MKTVNLFEEDIDLLIDSLKLWRILKSWKREIAANLIQKLERSEASADYPNSRCCDTSVICGSCYKSPD